VMQPYKLVKTCVPVMKPATSTCDEWWNRRVLKAYLMMMGQKTKTKTKNKSILVKKSNLQ
jgi:hypothetical protein